jgi:hypothetical protein
MEMPELKVETLSSARGPNGEPSEMDLFNMAFATLDIKVADRALVREKVLLTCQAAKAKLKAAFKGAFPGGAEIGLIPLRPEHWGGSRTWGTYYFASATWLDYVIAAKSTLEDHFSCIWEVEERNCNTVRSPVEMAWFIGPYTLPVMDLRPIRTSMFNRVALPEPIFITEKQSVDADLNFDTAPGARLEIRPVGIVVSTGANLIKKRPT